jgi:hypothetical protein
VASRTFASGKPTDATDDSLPHPGLRSLAADSDDPGQGFQLKAATIPIEGGQYWPVGTFMGSQRW